MNIITCHDWTDDGQYQWAPTNDPRVVAVLVRDEHSTVADSYDGDAINPILYAERGRVHWVAGFDGDEAQAINRAFETFDRETAARYLWIFHGIVWQSASEPGDYDGRYLVVMSSAYAEHVGITDRVSTKQAAIDDTASVTTDLQDFLDGYVYGIGYAVNKDRVIDDGEPVDITDDGWEIFIECYGYVGEDYSRQSAASFENGHPDLIDLSDSYEVTMERHVNIRRHSTLRTRIPRSMLADRTYFDSYGDPTPAFDQWMCDNADESAVVTDGLDNDDLYYDVVVHTQTPASPAPAPAGI
jgi:hypothetical protein